MEEDFNKVLESHLEVFDAMVQDYEANKALISAKIDDLGDKHLNVTKQLSKCKDAIGTLSGMLENTKVGLSYSTIKLGAHDSDIESLQKSISSIEASNLSLTEDVTVAKKEIDKLESQFIAVVNALNLLKMNTQEYQTKTTAKSTIIERRVDNNYSEHFERIGKLENKLNKTIIANTILIGAVLAYLILRG